MMSNGPRARASSLSCASMLVLMATGSAGAAAPLMAPSAPSDVILSLRPQHEGELRLQYRRELPNNTAETVSVGIAADYHYVDTAEGLTIYDYKLRRIFSVPRDGKSFVNDSLYAEVWYRALQLTNRVIRARAVKGAGPLPQATAATDPFWMETELGVVSAELPRPQLQQLSTEGGMRWLLEGEEVVAVRYQEKAVPAAVRGSLRRFWPTFVRIHPAIADALARSARMPAQLWVRELPAGKPSGTTHWTLTSEQWDSAAHFPLPPHLPARPTDEQGAYPEVFATLATAVSEKKIPPPQITYRLKAENAIERGAGLEATLWLMEMNLARGRPFEPCEHEDDPRLYCRLAFEADRLAQHDSRTAIAFTAGAPAAADRRQFATLPNVYVLQLIWSTHSPALGPARNERERDLLAALRASPVANFCKDAGLFYASEWEPFAAWQMWDFGRRMAGHVSGDLLDSIDLLESDLAARQAALF